MSIRNLIKQNLLQKIENISLKQVKKRFFLAQSFLNSAKIDFKNQNKENIIIYDNLYNAVRLFGETFLLLNNYKATVKNHHKTVIEATKLIMQESDLDKDLEFLFNRLDRMRKNRNKLDYDFDAFDVSKRTLKNMLVDVEKFADQVANFIDKKDLQKKLI